MEKRPRAAAPVMAGFFHQRDFVNGLAQFTHEAPRFVDSVTSTGKKLVPANNMISLDFLPCYPYLRLVDSCNGLLLCVSAMGKPSATPLYYYVCNPATKRWLGLPKPWYLKSMPVSEVLDFDPRRSPYNFKLVLIHARESGTLVMLDVYYSETGRWVHSCLLMEIEQVPLHLLWDVPVVLGGVMYKLASKDRLLKVNYSILESNSSTTSTTTTTRRLGVVRLPRSSKLGTTTSGQQVFLGRSKGRLYCAFLEYAGAHLQVWELLQDCREEHSHEQWDLKLDEVLVNFAIHPGTSPAKYRKDDVDELGGARVVAFHPDSPVIFLAVSGKVVSFNFGCSGTDSTPEVVCSLKPVRINDCVEEFRACPYTPCLSANFF